MQTQLGDVMTPFHSKQGDVTGAKGARDVALLPNIVAMSIIPS